MSSKGISLLFLMFVGCLTFLFKSINNQLQRDKEDSSVNPSDSEEVVNTESEEFEIVVDFKEEV